MQKQPACTSWQNCSKGKLLGAGPPRHAPRAEPRQHLWSRQSETGGPAAVRFCYRAGRQRPRRHGRADADSTPAACEHRARVAATFVAAGAAAAAAAELAAQFLKSPEYSEGEGSPGGERAEAPNGDVDAS